MTSANPALPPVTDPRPRRELTRCACGKAATRELDAIAAQRRHLLMVELPDYTLEAERPVRLVDVFDGASRRSRTTTCGPWPEW